MGCKTFEHGKHNFLEEYSDLNKFIATYLSIYSPYSCQTCINLRWIITRMWIIIRITFSYCEKPFYGLISSSFLMYLTHYNFNNLSFQIDISWMMHLRTVKNMQPLCESNLGRLHWWYFCFINSHLVRSLVN